MNTKELGYFAEGIAGRYLEERDYIIIERNYQKPWGEIDIVAQKDGITVFVEVKANKRAYVGGFDPECRVDRRKMSALIKTAMLYMEYEMKSMNSEWRIDIISVIFNEQKKSARIKQYFNIAEAYS